MTDTSTFKNNLGHFEHWLNNAEPGNNFIVADGTVEGWLKEQVDEFNALIDGQKATGRISTEKKSDGLWVTRTAADQSNIYKDGKTDERVGSVDDGNPFRSRYRKLSPVEVSHHDDIKRVAFDLWKLIEDTPKIRTGAGQRNEPPIYRDMALARTHLEDVVMRAVRALTA